MKNIKLTSLFSLTLITCIALINAGCTAPVIGMAEGYKSIHAYSKVEHRGYLIEIGQIKAGGFRTASYLPERVKSQLEKKLRQKGLLATSPKSERRLIVNIQVGASYPPFAERDAYDEIQSRIKITDIDKKEIVSETTIRSLNAYGWTGDFTEITHVEQITSFLEQLVI